MKRGKEWVIIILVISALLGLFSTYNIFTSNLSNNISFSKPSGWYEENFSLEINNIPANCEVRYTLNGDNPNYDSLLYEAPIFVSDASKNENVFSKIKDVSLAYDKEKIQSLLGCDSPNYKVPDYLIDKCTVVKAACFRGETQVGNVISASYFVDFDEKKGYEDISIISITADAKDLFDYDDGIYVTGKALDTYINKKKYENKPSWWFWGANYQKRGPESEISAYVEYYDENHEYEFGKKVGLRIKGGGSRAYNPKSLGLYAREEIDGEGSFKYDFWGTGYDPNEVVLFSGSTDYNTKIKDSLAADMAHDLGVADTHYRPCVVFLNGEYWGLCYITEKINKEFFDYYYNLGDSDVMVVKDGEIIDGDSRGIASYEEMVEYFDKNDMSIEENYRYVETVVDIEDYATYMALQTYIARTGDWPAGNMGWWKTAKKIDDKEGDSRWRPFLYDVNWLSMEKELIEYNSIEQLQNDSSIFASLWKNDEFKELYKNKVMEIIECFNSDRMNEMISNYYDLLEDSIEVSNKRFFGDSDYADSVFAFPGMDSHQKAVEEIREYFNKRGEYLKQLLSSYFQKEESYDFIEDGIPECEYIQDLHDDYSIRNNFSVTLFSSKDYLEIEAFCANNTDGIVQVYVNDSYYGEIDLSTNWEKKILDLTEFKNDENEYCIKLKNKQESLAEPVDNDERVAYIKKIGFVDKSEYEQFYRKEECFDFVNDGILECEYVKNISSDYSISEDFSVTLFSNKNYLMIEALSPKLDGGKVNVNINGELYGSVYFPNTWGKVILDISKMKSDNDMYCVTFNDEDSAENYTKDKEKVAYIKQIGFVDEEEYRSYYEKERDYYFVNEGIPNNGYVMGIHSDCSIGEDFQITLYSEENCLKLEALTPVEQGDTLNVYINDQYYGNIELSNVWEEFEMDISKMKNEKNEYCIRFKRNEDITNETFELPRQIAYIKQIGFGIW